MHLQTNTGIFNLRKVDGLSLIYLGRLFLLVDFNSWTSSESQRGTHASSERCCVCANDSDQ